MTVTNDATSRKVLGKCGHSFHMVRPHAFCRVCWMKTDSGGLIIALPHDLDSAGNIQGTLSNVSTKYAPSLRTMSNTNYIQNSSGNKPTSDGLSCMILRRRYGLIRYPLLRLNILLSQFFLRKIGRVIQLAFVDNCSRCLAMAVLSSVGLVIVLFLVSQYPSLTGLFNTRHHHQH